MVTIDRQRRSLRDSRGDELAWDRLVLATGSRAFVPPIPGHDDARCFVYRTLDDLDALSSCARHSRRGVVIGGGLLGLEAANALHQLGLETHVVEFSPCLMAVPLDDDGVQVHTAKQTEEIARAVDHSLTLRFADDEQLDTDLVLFSTGIRPRDELAREADLTLGPRGGIEINAVCQTSDNDIYSIGECALWNKQIFGLVAPGYQMARVLADYLAGEASAFSCADMSTKLKLLSVEVASFGDAHGLTPGSQSL
nr:nitrite reductase [Candidatus Pantoea persica]